VVVAIVLAVSFFQGEALFSNPLEEPDHPSSQIGAQTPSQDPVQPAVQTTAQDSAQAQDQDSAQPTPQTPARDSGQAVAQGSAQPVTQGPAQVLQAAGETPTDPNRWEYLIPYLLCFVGVALFVMNTARKKGDDWDFGQHYGDHAFRVAQAFGYLLVVWWAWASIAGAEIAGTSLPPNILGFMVGFFILRVERAMEGLGDKFEEMLKAVLPRAIAYQSTEDRKRYQLRGMYRIEDILSEWKAIRPQIDDLGARDMIDRAFDSAVDAAHGEDPEKARQAVEEVGRLFEDVKRGVGEVLVPIEDLLGPSG